ncbi:MAG: hypothetical protein H6Q76_1516 [Firmicutes bacterium]|nr:hypothetical protein [Bacillota bacterium]
MAKGMNNTKYNSKLRSGVLRRGQFIGAFGVGSIVNLPDESVMPAAIEYWHVNAGEKIFDERLQRRLGVDYFKMLPSPLEYKDGVPAYRFPKWLFCPKCKSLRHVNEWRDLYAKTVPNALESKIPRCHIDKIKLIPSRFVVACFKGHIDDFPWVEWVHGKTECEKPDLEIKTDGSGSGLGGIWIKCKTCMKQRSMAGAFDKELHETCTGFMPWLNEYETCNADPKPRTLQRGASNVYFPKVATSIVIPPYSDDLIDDVCGTDEWFILAERNSVPVPEATKEFLIQSIAKKISRSFADVKIVIEKLLSAGTVEVVETEIDYRYSEFQAFLGNIDEGELDSRQFRIEIRQRNEYDIPGIENVVLVHRLREVRALVAFSRVKPLDRDELGPDEEKEGEKPIAVAIKHDEKTNWLPAAEVFGEGIFIRFNDLVLKEWQETNEAVRQRGMGISERFEAVCARRGSSARKISPKYLFLHTFAHMLIRQLSFECGYGGASIRERIYCDEQSTDPTMSGVLIYTASGDSDGTLGGLVRQGRPEFFNAIVRNAIQNAEWCSSDPLCIESTGQGMDSLNLAACHACCLLPETCCEEFNRLLDRGMVIGIPDNPDMGFLSRLLRR